MAKKQKTAPEGVVDIFSVLADGEGEPETQPQGPTPAQLEAKMVAMEAELRRLERTNSALMTQQAVYTPPQTAAATPGASEPDFSNLPDPVTDAENYHKEVAKRITAHLEGKQKAQQAALDAQAQEQQTRQGQVATLWSDFEEKYPDLAEHRDMVEFAAIAVANRARQKGMDVNRYMFGASETYIEDVAQEMKKRFGKALEVMKKGDGEGDEEDGEAEPASMADAITAARTRGITGAIPGSGKGGEGGKAAPEEDTGLIGDLQKIQKSMGII